MKRLFKKIFGPGTSLQFGPGSKTIWSPESMLPVTGKELVPAEYHDFSFKSYIIWLYELADRKVKNYLRSKGWAVD